MYIGDRSGVYGYPLQSTFFTFHLSMLTVRSCYGEQRFYGQAIRVEAKAEDDTVAGGGDHGAMPELFPAMYVADVYLDDGRSDGANGVV